MAEDIAIEFVGPERATTVHAIMLAAFGEYATTLAVTSSALDESVDDVAEQIGLGGALIATSGGDEVSSARFELREGYVYIGRLSVLPVWRGRGIATRMIKAIEDHALSLGITEARLSTRGGMLDNIHLYERLGYAVTRRYSHPRGDDVIVDMTKVLGGP